METTSAPPELLLSSFQVHLEDEYSSAEEDLAPEVNQMLSRPSVILPQNASITGAPVSFGSFTPSHARDLGQETLRIGQRQNE